MSGEIEVDESFFGARRVKGKRGGFGFGRRVRHIQGQWPGYAESCRTAGKPRYRPTARQVGADSPFIRTDSAATTGWWIWVIVGT